MFPVALIVIAKKWPQHKCPSAGHCTSQLQNIHTGTHSNESVLAMTCTGGEVNMPSARSFTMIQAVHVHLPKIVEHADHYTGTEGRAGVAWGQGPERRGNFGEC